MPRVPPTIVVEADSFELRVDEEIAVWRGAVVARQGSHLFRTSTLTMQLDQLLSDSDDSEQSDNASDNEAGLPADYELSAASVSYDLATNVIAADGDCMLRRGAEFIAADRIRFAVDERVAYALPGEGGRVSVQFYGSAGMPLFLNPLAAAE